MELRDNPMYHSPALSLLSTVRVIASKSAQVEAGHTHSLFILGAHQLDQLLDHLEVVYLEGAHVLLPEVVRVAGTEVQDLGLQLLCVQVEGGQHLVIGVQHVQHGLERLGDVAILEHTLVQQIQATDGLAGDELLREHGTLDHVLHNGDDHADDLLARVDVQRVGELTHDIVLALLEQA